MDDIYDLSVSGNGRDGARETEVKADEVSNLLALRTELIFIVLYSVTFPLSIYKSAFKENICRIHIYCEFYSVSDFDNFKKIILCNKVLHWVSLIKSEVCDCYENMINC